MVHASGVGHQPVGRPTIPYDDIIARTWGQPSAPAQLRGRPRPRNDTWVAAINIQPGIGLVTLNRKVFADFGRHDNLDVLLPMLLGDA